MDSQRLLGRLGAALLAVAIAACATSSATLQTGMTPDQAIEAMGSPDLKDAVPDPQNNAGTLLRYTWVEAGKTATFGPNDRLATVQDIKPSEPAPAQQQTATAFDPINTPINYVFFPVRAAFIYLGAGLNCAVEFECHKPKLPSPTQS